MTKPSLFITTLIALGQANYVAYTDVKKASEILRQAQKSIKEKELTGEEYKICVDMADAVLNTIILCKLAKPSVIKKGYVYFIVNKTTKSIKIGFSTDPLARLKSLRTGSSHPLELIKFIPGSFKLESSLKKRFKHLSIDKTYEWFRAEKELTDFIAKQSSKFRNTSIPSD